MELRMGAGEGRLGCLRSLGCDVRDFVFFCALTTAHDPFCCNDMKYDM